MEPPTRSTRNSFLDLEGVDIAVIALEDDYLRADSVMARGRFAKCTLRPLCTEKVVYLK